MIPGVSLFYFQLFLVLGLVASLEDWRERRIRNLWILLGMLACLLGLAALLINTLLGERGVRFLDLGEYYLPWPFYPKVAAHLALSLTAALSLWRLEVWPAGDAKLFILFSFFLALIDPNLSGFPLLLFMVLLINVFVPPGLLLAAETLLLACARIPSLFKLDWGREAKAAAHRTGVRLAQAWPHRAEYLVLGMNLFALFFVLRLAEARFQRLVLGPFGHLLVYLFLCALWERISVLLRLKAAGIAALALASLGALFASLHLRLDLLREMASGLRMAFNFGLFLSLARGAFAAFLERQSLAELKEGEVRPGLLLSEETWERLKKEEALSEKLGAWYPDGLSPEETEALRAWIAQGGRGAGFTAYRAIPFAVWLFLGALLTLSFPRTVVSLLISSFKEGGAGPSRPGPALAIMNQRVDLKVGFRCNNLCKFCVQGDKRERLPAKPLEDLARALARGRRSGARGVVITGGEPTLHKGILELARLARSLGFETVQVQSNGRFFCYESFVSSLSEAGVTEFSPSLHGSRPEIHDFLTGVPGSFLQTVAGMRNVKRKGLRLLTNTVITKANYRDLPEIARLLVSLGVEQYQFAFMHVSGRAALNKEWLLARKALVEPWVKRGLDVGLAAGRRVMTEAIPYCLMRGYEDCVAERIIPATIIFDAETVIEDYTRARRAEGKAKGPLCPGCAWFEECEGPWREYPEMFGWDEFVPVEKACKR